LGALSTRSGQKLRDSKRHPTIEDHVTIYAGSTILGGETVIGEASVIGGNAFITHSIPANTKVSVVNPELKLKDGTGEQKTSGEEAGIWEKCD
jgi:serine O-acetyltransferase